MLALEHLNLNPVIGTVAQKKGAPMSPLYPIPYHLRYGE